MSDRKRMDIDSFDLLIRALHREYAKDPKRFSIQSGSIFYYGSSTQQVHLFQTSSGDFWPTIGTTQFEYYAPWWFSRKNLVRHNMIMKLINEIRGTNVPEVESLICSIVPSAKEVIAERLIVGDHNA